MAIATPDDPRVSHFYFAESLSMMKSRFFQMMMAISALGACFAPPTRGASEPVTENPTTAPSEHSALTLLPWPKSVEAFPGTVILTADSRIVSTDAALAPLAEILAAELHAVVGLNVRATDAAPRAGDIVLRLDPTLRADDEILTVHGRDVVKVRDYAHTIVADDRVTITGWDYRAAAEGTATLLQLVQRQGDAISVPKVKIRDWPYSDFNAAMVDLGRQLNTIDDLKQMILTCRAYKVRYLDLHMTDDQAWTFPSTAYPQLGTRNGSSHGGPAPVRMELAALKDLVKFADARGVTLVPEFEAPGHSGNARGTLPAIFGYIDPATGKPQDQGMMNIANPKAYEAIDTIIGEMLDVFSSSPYINMGFDEVSGLPAVLATPQAKEFMAKNHLANGGELLKHFALAMDDMVKKRGKKMILWEGAASTASKDIIILTWDSESRQAEALQAKGITTITVPWNLGVPWPQWSMVIANGSVLKPTDSVLGAMLPAWEQKGEVHIRWLRGLPQRQERTWGPFNLFTEAGFKRRLASTDAVTDRLLYGFSVHHDGETNPDLFRIKVTKSVSLSLTPAPGVGQLHFTTNGSEPTAASPVMEGPLAIDDSLTVKAQLFDASGKPIAARWQQPYLFEPLTIAAQGMTKNSAGKETDWFAADGQISIVSATPGGVIHYTLDGSEPIATSPTFASPIQIADTTTIKARWFNEAGQGRGSVVSAQYHKLAGLQHEGVGKPVTLLVPATIAGKEQIQPLLTDGLLMRDGQWQAPEVARFDGSDCEVVIDMGKPTALRQVGARFLYAQEVGIFPSPKMTVSISDDNKTFEPLGEAGFVSPDNHNSRGTTIKTLMVDAKGETARYIKIHSNNLGLIPAWHPVKGAPAHLMMDEVIVNPEKPIQSDQ
jgi:hexosaminidase